MWSPGVFASELNSSRLAGFVLFGRLGIPLAFALVMAPVFLIVGLMVVRAEQDGATQALIRATEVQNAGVARTLANAHADPISYLLAFDIGDAPDLIPIAVRRSGLARLIAASLHETNVVNVKLYDGDGVTLFSLDQKALGEDISSCECFSTVLANGTYSELVHRGDGVDLPVHDGHSHVGGDIDILTTMIRLSVLTPQLVASDGVLEVQSDMTGLIAPIVATRRETGLVVGLPLVALYLFMVTIVFLGHGTIVRRDRQAAALAARAAESEASDRAKSEFLSLMSHELRTPLNAIVGFAHLIADTCRNKSDDETAGWADAVHDSGLHMTRVVSSILDMTALELGELELDLKVLHLRDVVRTAVNAVGPSFDNGLVILDVHDDDGQAPVLGDADKLGQVFENLLSNAARFTPAGGTVDVTYDATPDGFVSVCIRDTGAGMTKEQIAMARLPFQANWAGYSREADGAGLGLTIADKIVKCLGGELVIESEAGRGSRVTVRLPACVSDRGNVTTLQPVNANVPATDGVEGMSPPAQARPVRDAIG